LIHVIYELGFQADFRLTAGYACQNHRK
jgi:hypothetical protein